MSRDSRSTVAWKRTGCAMPDRSAVQRLVEGRQHVLDHRRRQPRIDADEEGVVVITSVLVSGPTTRCSMSCVGRVPQQVAAEEIAGLDAGGFERVDQFARG